MRMIANKEWYEYQDNMSTHTMIDDYNGLIGGQGVG